MQTALNSRAFLLICARVFSPQGDAPRLYLRAVKMHHAHRALADTHGADKDEQSAKAKPLKNRFENQQLHGKYASLGLALSVPPIARRIPVFGMVF